MIITEVISGPITLCRLHPDPESPEYSAQWILTESGEIKGLMAINAKPAWVLEFGAWCREQKGPLKISTSNRAIEWIMRRFGFVKMVRG